MPVLPIIDLFILLGWSSLGVGFVLKAVWMTTSYRPTLLGLSPADFLWVAGVFLLLSLSLAARTWVKLNEPRLLARRRRNLDEEFPERASNHSQGLVATEAVRADRNA